MFRNCKWKGRARELLLPALVLAELLSGCGAPADSVPETDQAGAAMRSEQLEESARPLSEDEILTAYHRAATLCGWFHLTPLPSGGSTIVLDGATYRQVHHDGVETLEDLRTCLRSVFSQEVTEALLAAGGETPMYRDIDGALYVTGSGRSPDPSKGHTEIEVEQTSADSYAVNISIDLLDADGETVTGLECWSFPYAFVDDRWVFTDFRLFY
ncbi:MAG: hypothetical protein HFF83_03410 [Oscillibacter sp.]|jgi:hypothetical protein|nr:hypothetical protein [Oscillibacter sp.]